MTRRTVRLRRRGGLSFETIEARCLLTVLPLNLTSLDIASLSDQLREYRDAQLAYASSTYLDQSSGQSDSEHASSPLSIARAAREGAVANTSDSVDSGRSAISQARDTRSLEVNVAVDVRIEATRAQPGIQILAPDIQLNREALNLISNFGRGSGEATTEVVELIDIGEIDVDGTETPAEDAAREHAEDSRTVTHGFDNNVNFLSGASGGNSLVDLEIVDSSTNDPSPLSDLSQGRASGPWLYDGVTAIANETEQLLAEDRAIELTPGLPEFAEPSPAIETPSFLDQPDSLAQLKGTTADPTAPTPTTPEFTIEPVVSPSEPEQITQPLQQTADSADLYATLDQTNLEPTTLQPSFNETAPPITSPIEQSPQPTFDALPMFDAIAQPPSESQNLDITIVQPETFQPEKLEVSSATISHVPDQSFVESISLGSTTDFTPTLPPMEHSLPEHSNTELAGVAELPSESSSNARLFDSSFDPTFIASLTHSGVAGPAPSPLTLSQPVIVAPDVVELAVDIADVPWRPSTASDDFAMTEFVVDSSESPGFPGAGSTDWFRIDPGAEIDPTAEIAAEPQLVSYTTEQSDLLTFGGQAGFDADPTTQFFSLEEYAIAKSTAEWQPSTTDATTTDATMTGTSWLSADSTTGNLETDSDVGDSPIFVVRLETRGDAPGDVARLGFDVGRFLDDAVETTDLVLNFGSSQELGVGSEQPFEESLFEGHSELSHENRDDRILVGEESDELVDIGAIEIEGEASEAFVSVAQQAAGNDRLAKLSAEKPIATTNYGGYGIYHSIRQFELGALAPVNQDEAQPTHDRALPAFTDGVEEDAAAANDLSWTNRTRLSLKQLRSFSQTLFGISISSSSDREVTEVPTERFHGDNSSNQTTDQAKSDAPRQAGWSDLAFAGDITTWRDSLFVAIIGVGLYVSQELSDRRAASKAREQRPRLRPPVR